jgi:dTDP-4-amino-4,6-dideoxygalactose transaminase
MITVFGSKVGAEEITNVVSAMEQQWMGFGKGVDKFEKEFKSKYQIPNFVMVDSGSNALFMAVSLLNLPPGSEVIVPSFTWVSCAQAILLAGMKPVFCDVDIRTMNITAETIAPHLSSKTGAIMVVHYAGLPVDMDEVKAFGLPIIEDAAHAVHSKYKGQHCGAIADVGIYSFDAVKNLTAGEGGGLASNNSELIERAKMLRYCGIGKSGFDAAVSNAKGKNRWWEYNISEPFIKMLPTNIAAGIASAQLTKIDELQAIRKKHWDIYQSEFKKLPWLITPVEANDGDRHSYFTYCIRVPKRDELAHYLLDNGIYTTLRYHPLHMNKLYAQMDVTLKNSETLNEDCLSIPLHPRLSDEDVEKIISEIKKFGDIKGL